MKRFSILYMALLHGAMLFPESASSQESKREFLFDQGGRSYVMKQYIMCFLKTGPLRSQTEEEAKKIQEGHLDHISQLADSGFILVAGPFGDDTSFRGILIFDVATVEEAKVLEEQDPAVKAGRLVAEYHPWWTSKEGSFK